MHKDEKTKIAQMQNDYQKVFLRTAAGRRVLKDLLAETGIFEISYVGGSDTISHTAFNEGRRSIGLKLLEALDRKSYAGLKELETGDVLDTDIFNEER